MGVLVDSNYRTYYYTDSFDRIDEILATPRDNFREVDSLPDREDLTYTNGYYANCSAVFIDLRESSELPNHYQRPTLAKIYRAFISETVAILNSSPNAREISIVGDCVWAVFNTPSKSDIDEVFNQVARLNSLMKVLAYKINKAGYAHPIRAGIGAAWGRALMIQAGYKGTGIYDVVYMGDVVNYASKLAAKANIRKPRAYGQPAWYGGYSYPDSFSPPVYLGNSFVFNLNAENKKFVTLNRADDCYTANVINTAMDEWYRENCT